MKVNYKIIVDHLDQPQLIKSANEFVQVFSEFRKGQTWFFQFEDKLSLVKALEILRTKNLIWDLVYELSIEEDEITHFPCYLLGLPTLYLQSNDDILYEKKLQRKQIFKEVQTDKIIVNEKVKNILESHSSSFDFQRIKSNKNNNFYILTIHEFLKEPIAVANVTQLNTINKEDELYFLVSDGRYFISKEKVLELEHLGILKYNLLRHNDKIYKVPNGLVMSPLMIQVLMKNKILGYNDFLIVLHNTDSILDEIN
ncbi:MAG: hypothetical protein SFU98_07050 [Leptospiraceae bacterium]|nr:hypothetical protein [Leptospiraceae bacterium]